MRVSTYFVLVAISALVFTSCVQRSGTIENRVVVSIHPLKPIAESILGDDFEVSVLVPQGVSPEVYEPTPKQLREIENARLVFATGLLDFEQALVHRVARSEQIVDLSGGIQLIAGSCSHRHHAHNHEHSHSHGVDPHIWCSPKSLGTMAENAFNAIVLEMPDSTKYEQRYTTLCVKLLELDEEVSEMCRLAKSPLFVIYHPALTYLARDYSLEQIAIEREGKEPSAKYLSEVIDKARQYGAKHIFYQSEFPASSVETICRDIGATAVEINPLSEDVFENIRAITKLITQ